IAGTGATALKNSNGEAFNTGADLSLDFSLDYGGQVVAVVPQPVSPGASVGTLTQSANEIDVYFNNTPLSPASASNPAFYQLINTADGTVQLPATVTYDPAHNLAKLVFSSNLAASTYHLRIGTDAPPDNSLATAVNVGTLFNTNPFNNTGIIG